MSRRCCRLFLIEWTCRRTRGVAQRLAADQHHAGSHTIPDVNRRTHLCAAALTLGLCVTVDAQLPELRWGGDAEGGAPFVEADPNDVTRLIGFDVEVARLLAEGLGRTPRFVQVDFASLEIAALRGDFDVGMSGLEDLPGRRSRLAVTVPYYAFREVLTVRETDALRDRSLEDLRGRRVATLGATLAHEILVEAEAEHGVVILPETPCSPPSARHRL